MWGESTDIIFLREELSTEIILELSFTVFLKNWSACPFSNITDFVAGQEN